MEARWENVAHIYLLERGVRVVARAINDDGAEEAGGRFKLYDFGDMLFPLQHKERCYKSLVSLHNKTLVDKDPDNTESVTPRSLNRAVRRLNSAPVQPSNGLIDLTPTPSKDSDDSVGEATNSTTPEDEEDSSVPTATTTTTTTTEAPPQTSASESSKAQLKSRWSEILEDKESYSETAVEVEYELFWGHEVRG